MLFTEELKVIVDDSANTLEDDMVILEVDIAAAGVSIMDNAVKTMQMLYISQYVFVLFTYKFALVKHCS